MPEHEKLSEEFLAALVNYHNPETIFKMAKTEWEKSVAIEFYLLKNEIKDNANEVKWLKWITKSIFAVTVLALIVNLMNVFGLIPI